MSDASTQAYRLALEASVEIAAPLLTRQATRSSPPLWEVVASRFSWAQITPWAPRSLATVLAAYTRVLLGEDLSQDDSLDAVGLGVPFDLQVWESTFWAGADALPHYSPNGFARIGAPVWLERPDSVALPEPVQALPAEVAAARAQAGLLKVVHGWDDATAVTVRGSVLDAVATVRGPDVHGIRGGYLRPGQAFVTLLDRAAGGVFSVPYQGLAVGRAIAWRALAGLTRALGEPSRDGLEVGPYDCPAIADFMDRSRWFQWVEPEHENALHLAVEDPASGLAWALDARTLSS